MLFAGWLDYVPRRKAANSPATLGLHLPLSYGRLPELAFINNLDLWRRQSPGAHRMDPLLGHKHRVTNECHATYR